MLVTNYTRKRNKMGLFDKLFSKKIEPLKVEAPKKERAPRKPKEKKVEPELTAKEKATLAGEPYVQILSMDIDPNDINSGSFDLDFNDKFILNLVRAGYKYKDTDTDHDILDRWWTQICRNTALAVYEQSVAGEPEHRDLRKMTTKDIGNGRTEVS